MKRDLMRNKMHFNVEKEIQFTVNLSKKRRKNKVSIVDIINQIFSSSTVRWIN